MALKAINNTAGLDELVPTLLVFSAFLQINIDLPPMLLILKRAKAIAKIMQDLRKYYAKKQIAKALSTQNGPNTTNILNILLQLEILVWRKKNSW